MASIDTGGGGKGGGKTKQKKQNLRVDFTPMVDMNMLLITFFMFCTSLAKPQTMEITMPMKEDRVEDTERPELPKELAFTIFLGSNHKVYYFAGMPTYEPAQLTRTDFSATGLRATLLQKNKDVIAQINELKAKRANREITDDELSAQTREIKRNASRAPYVIIKASESAVYRDLVDALDEMLIANIVQYTIAEITPQEVEWLSKAEALNN
ncbi:MAG: biopolymer transporter ExbD [Prevotellaceae bacterium]|jgi:biopolymer transport protein ExbD|nr:biopolymer transporter ExbD [Prevotellaceae bacterium]